MSGFPKVEKQIARISHNPSYKVVHCEEIWIRDGRRVNPKVKHKKYGGYIFENAYHFASFLLRRLSSIGLFQELGYFDESLPACEDYDLWLRICAKYPVLFVEEPLLRKFGGHDDQLSKKFWGMDR